MPQDVRLGDWVLRASFRNAVAQPSEQDLRGHGGLTIRLGRDEYVVAGCGLTVTCSTAGAIAGIRSVRQGQFADGRPVPTRLPNGDERHQGRHLRIPGDTLDIQRVRLYRYR